MVAVARASIIDMNRRQFLQTSAAASLVVAAGALTASADRRMLELLREH